MPKVHWILQLDCPESVEVYIHRAGRTARNAKRGESLLILTKSQVNPILSALKERKIENLELLR